MGAHLTRLDTLAFQKLRDSKTAELAIHAGPNTRAALQSIIDRANERIAAGEGAQAIQDRAQAQARLSGWRGA